VQIVEWDRTHRFCSRCGEPTERMVNERARRCARCGLLAFPRLSPAVIVRVLRDDQILLGHNRAFPPGLYSVLAGFVEPGETLEETVEREIFEEVGIEVTDLRYFASQPWPYPNSLMLGFTARHAGGEIRVDQQELADARWFSRDNLPELPGKLSIARRLIDDWLGDSARP
jgi:NAD+ diphosphatase